VKYDKAFRFGAWVTEINFCSCCEKKPKHQVNSASDALPDSNSLAIKVIHDGRNKADQHCLGGGD
jgi:hypothetical protein